jgi:tetratricopeptide (TPR) repeat protein
MADTTVARSALTGMPSEAQIQYARRLFDQAQKARATDSGRFAIHALTEAICHDPSQRQYAKELVTSLFTASVVGPGRLATALPAWRLARRLAASIATNNWQAALESGTKLLVLRPRSIAALLGLGRACTALKCFDSALVYLRHAHKLQPHDVVVNRHCGRVLGKVQQFDEAVACWSIIRQQLPRDEEALKAIGDLATKKLF